MGLLKITHVDTRCYEQQIKDFLPEKIIDIHTHVWLEKHRNMDTAGMRSASWPKKVARQNPIKDLMEVYTLLFPGKTVQPLIFSIVKPGDDIVNANRYVTECGREYNVPTLIFCSPLWSAQELDEYMSRGVYKGAKVYLDFAPPYIPKAEIRIYDFLPHHQLDYFNRKKMVVMLHIPRPGRLKDPVNLNQMLEIEKEYPDIKLIIAHVGRAYCPEDVGNAFEVLSQTDKMLFDISANTNAPVFEQLIHTVGPKRILFGSDLPITRMKMKRICEDGTYINLVPPNLYDGISNDKHMREVSPAQANNLTFFLYEQILAFKSAAERCSLARQDIEDVFYKNAIRILNG